MNQDRDDKRPLDPPKLAPSMTRRDLLKASLTAGAACAAGPALSACGSALPPLESSPVWQPASKERLLLVGARVIDVDAGCYRDEDALLIEDGRIAALGPATDLADVPHDHVADLSGRTVVPGLINAHCHMTMSCTVGLTPAYIRDYKRQVLKNCEACVRHGVTTVRDMLGPHKTVRELKEAIDRGERLGPRIVTPALGVGMEWGYPAAPIPVDVFSGTFVTRIDSPAEAKDAVKRAVDKGAEFIKTFHQKASVLTDRTPYNTITLAELETIRNEADRHGLPVALHITAVEGFRMALDAEIPSFEHMPRDGLLTDRDVERFVDLGVPLVPTFSIAWALNFHSEGDPYQNDPFVRRLREDRAKRLDDLLEAFCVPSHAAAGRKTFADYDSPGYFDRRHLLPGPDAPFFTQSTTLGRTNLMKLHRAGAIFGAGNDGGVPFSFQGAMAFELQLMTWCEFTPAEALRAATITNARLLGLEKEIGSVEAGKTADLVVLDGDPLASVDPLESPVAVFQGGRLVHGPTGLIREV